MSTAEGQPSNQADASVAAGLSADAPGHAILSTTLGVPIVPSASEVIAGAARARRSSSHAATRRLWQRRVVVVLLAITDLSALVLALRLAQWTYRSPWLLALHTGDAPRLLPTLLLWGGVVFPTFALRGLYRFAYRDGLYSIGRSATSVLLASALYAVIIYFMEIPIARTFALLVVTCSLVMLCGSRTLFRTLAARLPPLSRRVIVVGGGASAKSAARMVAQYWRQGLYLVRTRSAASEAAPGGRSDAEQSAIDDSALDTDDLHRIAAYIRERDVDDVVLTREWYERNCPDVARMFAMLNRLPAQVHVASGPAELLTRMSVDDFSGLPVIKLGALAHSPWQLALKRALDMLVAGLLLVLLSPLMLVIALAIRRDSAGPAIFKQRRVGHYHQFFTIYKFRSMYCDDSQVRSLSGSHKYRGDPRVTRVGRILRRTSLDELPQLVNVLKGEMSLVGPRPELPEITAQYQPWQYGRLLMPPGITGWWQINGRGERLLHEHVEDDIYYVRNYSFLLDCKILVMTVRAMISGRGAF